jgi:hypothetical protein
MTPAEKLSRIRLIVIAGFAAAVAYCLIQSQILGRVAAPYSTFLFDPRERFTDFLLNGAARSMDPYAYPGSVYFPFAFVSLFPFMLLKGHAGLYPYLLAVSAFAWHHCKSAFERLGLGHPGLSAFAIVFLSYPMLFELDRANFEGWVFVFTGLFLSAYRKGRYPLSAVMLGCAAAIKGYPGLFCLLFLSERRFRELGIFFATIAAASLLGAMVFDTGLVGTMLKLQDNLRWFHQTYVVRLDSLVFNSSLFGLLRILFSPFVPGLMPVDAGVTGRWAGAYMALSGALQLGAIAWVLFLEKTLWKRVFLIVASFILLPPVSFDYKLIHLLLPLLLFVEDRKVSRYDGAYAALFGLLLIPKAYIVLHDAVSARPDGTEFHMAVSSTSVLTPALLLAFVALLALDRGRPAASPSAQA